MKSDNDKGTQEREASVPIHASSVIIIRDATEDMYEIFLMKRHRNQSFMGGAYVFPGGRLDDMDCSSELVSCICGISSSNAKLILQEPDLPDDIACGLFCAALRETFEEAGILLAYFSEGNLVNFLDEEIRQHFSQYRKRLMNNELSFIEISREENILFAFDLLLPYAHWITPEAEAAFKTKRFDTRFFIARMPGGQQPIHDGMEMTDSLWITPCLALEKQKAGEIMLMPPTLKIIEELNAYKSTDELLSSVNNHKINTVLPQPFAMDDGFGLKLPHDPEYTIAAYKQSPRPNDPSRIVLQNGIWTTKLID